jgi:pyruvate dehydrogenase E2 component (dihydrolipoamide acetyltransferase)
MIKEITIPEIGENVESGEVAKVRVAVGDMVEVDQTIIELETDKALVEIPSPAKGKITEILVKEGDQIKIGQVIGKMDTEGQAPAPEEKLEKTEAAPPEPKEAPARAAEPEPKPVEKKPAPPKPEPPKLEKQPEPAAPEVVHAPEQRTTESRRRAPAGPSVRRLARELGADINLIKGTGGGGRITPDDVKQYVKNALTGIVPAEKGLPDFRRWGSIEREPMTKVRRLTAESTGFSWRTIPHVTQFDEADITEVEEFRQKHGPDVEKDGGKLTLTAILLKVMAAALKTFPKFNASLDVARSEVVYKKYYHIGLAVDTDRGLLIPVIRNVDQKTIKQLALELTDIADRTRNKKIKPEELEGGTFTISNQGSIGGSNFTPIVYWPQVAILGVSRAGRKPAFAEGICHPRTILPLALSYDHRVIDGADAARFLSWVVDALEHPFLLHFQ